MPGCTSETALLVDAEIDSMGEVSDGGAGIVVRTSRRKAAIEDVQGELRRRRLVREDIEREIKFIKEGGNPLEFRAWETASVGHQSNSVTDLKSAPIMTSEAKGSFALTALHHGYLVQGSGTSRRSAAFEPSAASNLLVSSAKNEILAGDLGSIHTRRKNNFSQVPKSSQIDGNNNTKKSEDLSAQRNRSRSNPNSPRSSSTDMFQNHHGHISFSASSLLTDEKTSVSQNNDLKDQSVTLISDLNSSKSGGDMVLSILPTDNLACSVSKPSLTGKMLDMTASNSLRNNDQRDQPCNSLRNDQLGLQPLIKLASRDINLARGEEHLGSIFLKQEYCSASKELGNSTTFGQLNEPSNLQHDWKSITNEKLINKYSLRSEARHSSIIGVVEENDSSVLQKNRSMNELLNGNSNPKSETYTGKPQGSMNMCISEAPKTSLSVRNSHAPADLQIWGTSHLKLADKIYENIILEEARTIEVKRKRIRELSTGILLVKSQRESHWHFVLEEMAWLANDFAQERLWKINAASRFCNQASLAYRSRFEKDQKRRLKEIAHNLAKTVMQLWHKAELHIKGVDVDALQEQCKHNLVAARMFDGTAGSLNETQQSDMETTKEVEQGCSRKRSALPVLVYIVRFLEYSGSPLPPCLEEATVTPDMMSEFGISRMSQEEKLREENLFFTVPSGAMEAYGELIGSSMAQSEKVGSPMQEEVELPMYNAIEENEYGKGERCTYLFHKTFGGGKSTKSSWKKQKKLLKSYSAKSHILRGDLRYGPWTSWNRQSMFLTKKPSCSLHGGPPTKQMRTASRGRLISPYGAGENGMVEDQAETDVSNGGTTTKQSEKSTLHGGSQVQVCLNTESVEEVEKHVSCNSKEAFKLSNNKAAKHLGLSVEHELDHQMDSNVSNEWETLPSADYGCLRDHSIKRVESHHFESSETSGLCGHHTKRSKIMKQSIDNNFDNINPMSASIPSPVVPQSTNISHSNNIIKLIGGWDRGKKAEKLKMSDEQVGYESAWSPLEDQELVVLVHDMGPNWELISDVMNSTLHFKFVHYKPQDCKERYEMLMDRNVVLCGSSKSYPSMLPHISKGSARKLFQRLQGPIEEETIKSHFEKIISIGKKLYQREGQNEKGDQKRVPPVHSSHIIALSQMHPNNLNGGILMPLELCNTTISSIEVLRGCQSSPGGGLFVPNHGDAFFTDGRCSVLRSSLLVNEQERLQQNSQEFPGRNIQHSGLSAPLAVSGTSCTQLLPAGNGTGILCRMNKNMALPEHGVEGMALSSTPSAESIVSSMSGTLANVNMYGRSGSSQGPVMQLHHNSELQRQVMGLEPQTQVTQGNSSFRGSASAFPGHLQHYVSPQEDLAPSNLQHTDLQVHNNATGSEKQASAVHLAKERQLQKRCMQQKQQQFTMSNSLVPHVHTQEQLPMPPSNLNSSLILLRPSSQSVPLPPLVPPPSSPMTPRTNCQLGQHLSSHGLGQNLQSVATGLRSQTGTQLQLWQQQQLLEQYGGNHQQAQSNLQTIEGVGRGNVLMQQSTSTDTVQLSGLVGVLKSQSVEKGEQIMNLIQNQGIISNAGVATTRSSKPYGPPKISNQAHLPLRLCSAALASGKKLQCVSSHSDNKKSEFMADQVDLMYTASHQAVLPITASSNEQLQLPAGPQQEQVTNETQPFERMPQQNFHVNSEWSSKSSCENTQRSQKPLKNASGEHSTMAMGQACVESPRVLPVASASQWKTSEQPYNSSMPNLASQQNSSGSFPLINSNGGKVIPPLSEGSGQRQLPRHSLSYGHNVEAQWQKRQRPVVRQSPTLVSSQYHHLQNEHLAHRNQK